MKPVNLASLARWANIADLHFVRKDLQWLEVLNEANVLYYRWLYYATRALQPAVALELGVCRAQASAHIAAGGAKVTIGVDRQPWQPEFDRNVAEIWARNYDYRFILGDTTAPSTRQSVEQIVRSCGEVELLFIDSTHLRSQVQGEWLTYGPMVAPGALIVMDDIREPPEMYQAFLEIPGQHIEFPNLHIAGRGSVGFGAIIYDGGEK